MKYVSLKKLLGKLIKKIGVLWGGAGFCSASRGRDGARKFSLSYGAEWEKGKTKSCGAGVKTPSFEPTLPYCHPYA